MESRRLLIYFKNSNKVINYVQNGNNVTVNNPKEIVEEFDNHFISITKNIKKKLIRLNCDFSKLLKYPNKESFYITPINKEEVASIIKTLKSNKSTRPSSIPTKLLKLF